MSKNKEIGIFGEDVAAKYLESINYKIVCRNFRCRMGEIDIIAKDKNEIVFVEVKTRCFLNYGKPAESINKLKQSHIYKVANYYLYINHLMNSVTRFDVVEVYIKGKNVKIEHIKNVEIYK